MLAALALPISANAAVTLNLVASFDKATTGAFGLAFDGTNIWYSNNSGSIYEMTTSGVNTGNVITGTTWSALAWNSGTNKIAIVENNGITQYDRAVGSQAGSALNPLHTNIAGSPNFLTDGLDIEGGQLWWSEDVSSVNHSALDGSGLATQFLGGAGGYSGVEYVTAGGNNYVIVVNDASNPRQLCIHNTDATLVGCTVLANSRYEDLGFDGRYLYAADYYGNRIDKIDLLVDGGSIFVPGAVPESSTWMMMIVGFGAAGSTLRLRRRKSVDSLA